jgi:hypothetical protein
LISANCDSEYQTLPGLIITRLNVQARRAPPFLKAEADSLLTAGYQDIGWRDVSSEAFGLPNPKHHVILVATAGPTAVVDCCLFSTVRPRRGRLHVCAAAHMIDQSTTHAGAGAQGSSPCAGCRDSCYQCCERGIREGEDAALAWNLGEIYGLSDPSRLPSPTTTSLFARQ